MDVVWGRYDEAFKDYQEVLEAVVKYSAGPSERQALVLLSIAQLQYMKKDYDKASKSYDESLSVVQELSYESQYNKQRLEAEISKGQGMIYEDKKEYEDALEYLNKSKRIYENIGIKEGVMVSLNSHIANIYRSKKEYERAFDLLNESLGTAKESAFKSLIAEVLDGLASVHSSKEEYDRALEFLNERLLIEKKLGNQSGIAFTLAFMGKIFIKKEMLQEALRYTSQAYNILKGLGLPDADTVLQDQSSIEDKLGGSQYENKDAE